VGAAFWGRGDQGYEGPLYAPNPHDLVILGGKKLPGKCEVKALPTQEYGREKAPGRDGAAIILQGYLPGPIDIAVLMWTPEQWEVFQDVMDLVWNRPGKISSGFSKRGQQFFSSIDKTASEAGQISRGAALAEQRAITIGHPALQEANITKVVVTGRSLPEPGPFPQSRIVNIKCLEFVESPKVSKTAVVKGDAKLAKPTHTMAPATVNQPGLSPGQGKVDGTPQGALPRGRQGAQ
jgi:hypothetical protein